MDDNYISRRRQLDFPFRSETHPPVSDN
jgi:hypothetical protein